MIYIGLFLFSVILTYIIKVIAIKKSLIANINERSSHTVPTPHGGGIAIAITWFIGLFYLYFNNQLETNLFYALMTGVIISIVSFLDDLYELSPKIRLIAQGITAFGGLYFLDLNILFMMFGFFMIVWYINLFNFLDGLNGYAGSEAVFIGVAGYLLFSNNIFLVLIVSVLGFLVWNYGNKAKIFMGDVGSTLLGYNIAIFTIFYVTNLENFLIWVLIFAPFWLDATLTLFRRYKNGEKLTKAHKKHFYQRLNQSGFSHLKVTNSLVLLNVIILGLIYFINIYVALLVCSVFLYIIIKYIDKQKRFE